MKWLRIVLAWAGLGLVLWAAADIWPPLCLLLAGSALIALSWVLGLEHRP